MAETTSFWTSFLSFMRKWGINILCVVVAVGFILTSRLSINQTQEQSQITEVTTSNYNENININLINGEWSANKKFIRYEWKKIPINRLFSNDFMLSMSSFQALFCKILPLNSDFLAVGVPILGTNSITNHKSVTSQTQSQKTAPSFFGWITGKK